MLLFDTFNFSIIRFDLEISIHKKIQPFKRELIEKLNQIDSQKSGIISIYNFRNILSSYKHLFTENEIEFIIYIMKKDFPYNSLYGINYQNLINLINKFDLEPKNNEFDLIKTFKYFVNYDLNVLYTNYDYIIVTLNNHIYASKENKISFEKYMKINSFRLKVNKKYIIVISLRSLISYFYTHNLLKEDDKNLKSILHLAFFPINQKEIESNKDVFQLLFFLEVIDKNRFVCELIKHRKSKIKFIEKFNSCILTKHSINIDEFLFLHQNFIKIVSDKRCFTLEGFKLILKSYNIQFNDIDFNFIVEHESNQDNKLILISKLIDILSQTIKNSDLSIKDISSICYSNYDYLEEDIDLVPSNTFYEENKNIVNLQTKLLQKQTKNPQAYARTLSLNFCSEILNKVPNNKVLNEMNIKRHVELHEEYSKLLHNLNNTDAINFSSGGLNMNKYDPRSKVDRSPQNLSSYLNFKFTKSLIIDERESPISKPKNLRPIKRRSNSIDISTTNKRTTLDHHMNFDKDFLSWRSNNVYNDKKSDFDLINVLDQKSFMSNEENLPNFPDIPIG